MYQDTKRFTTNCPQCAIVTGGSRRHRPPLHPIPVSRPFQIVVVDILELPKTDSGNQYLLVLQDFLTKWPFAFPLADQKTHRIVELLVTEVVPVFGVLEALLSRLPSILNATVWSNSFTGPFKAILRKYAATFGSQWDLYVSGALWAYRNVPHESTGEKPSFLLLGIDCRTPTEAALLPSNGLKVTKVSNYREKVILSLSTARRLAA